MRPCERWHTPTFATTGEPMRNLVSASVSSSTHTADAQRTRQLPARLLAPSCPAPLGACRQLRCAVAGSITPCWRGCRHTSRTPSASTCPKQPRSACDLALSRACTRGLVWMLAFHGTFHRAVFRSLDAICNLKRGALSAARQQPAAPRICSSVPPGVAGVAGAAHRGAGGVSHCGPGG